MHDKDGRKSRPLPHLSCMICRAWCWLTGRPCWTKGGTWLPVSLRQHQHCEAAVVEPVAVTAAVYSVSAEPASVWSDGRRPAPTNCAVSCTHKEHTTLDFQAVKSLTQIWLRIQSLSSVHDRNEMQIWLLHNFSRTRTNHLITANSYRYKRV